MNIILADSHTICREALAEFIRHSNPMFQVESVGDYAGFLQAVDHVNPDIVLFDPELQGLAEGCDALLFFQKNPSLRVGVFATQDQADHSLLSPHVHGFFPKNLASKDIVEGLYKIVSEGQFVGEVDHYGSPDNTPRRSIDEMNFTAREKQVLAFLMKGATNKDIARALELQVVTIKLHVRGICRKMNAKNRTQAALMGQENGWE
jgi:two-component system nitrate/nitrite response regulator NarL